MRRAPSGPYRSYELSDKDLLAILQKRFDRYQGRIRPFMRSITAAEAKRLLKMGRPIPSTRWCLKTLPRSDVP